MEVSNANSWLCHNIRNCFFYSVCSIHSTVYHSVFPFPFVKYLRAKGSVNTSTHRLQKNGKCQVSQRKWELYSVRLSSLKWGRNGRKNEYLKTKWEPFQFLWKQKTYPQMFTCHFDFSFVLNDLDILVVKCLFVCVFFFF